jgi:hypothetical protein
MRRAVLAGWAAVIRSELMRDSERLEAIFAEICRERAENILPGGNISPERRYFPNGV